jgi:hypothetical protein
MSDSVAHSVKLFTTILTMFLLIRTLLIIAILITLNTGNITNLLIL